MASGGDAPTLLAQRARRCLQGQLPCQLSKHLPCIPKHCINGQKSRNKFTLIMLLSGTSYTSLRCLALRPRPLPPLLARTSASRHRVTPAAESSSTKLSTLVCTCTRGATHGKVAHSQHEGPNLQEPHPSNAPPCHPPGGSPPSLPTPQNAQARQALAPAARHPAVEGHSCQRCCKEHGEAVASTTAIAAPAALLRTGEETSMSSSPTASPSAASIAS